MKSITARLFLALALLSGAFASPTFAQKAPAGGGGPQGKVFPVNVAWELVSVNGAAPEGEKPTLQLDSQLRMRGFGGCNTFSATAYPLKNQGITVGPVAVTSKTCDKAVMEAEKVYLLGLRTALQWDVSGGLLVLRGEKAELKFQRALF